jgi:hypothetical protein
MMGGTMSDSMKNGDVWLEVRQVEGGGYQVSLMVKHDDVCAIFPYAKKPTGVEAMTGAKGISEHLIKGIQKIRTGPLGPRYLVRVIGEGCGRGRYVEKRRYLGQWRCHALLFEEKADAEAFCATLSPLPGQRTEVRPWPKAEGEMLLNESLWDNTPKIALITA